MRKLENSWNFEIKACLKEGTARGRVKLPEGEEKRVGRRRTEGGRGKEGRDGQGGGNRHSPPVFSYLVSEVGGDEMSRVTGAES
jgi:hypothetical protein